MKNEEIPNGWEKATIGSLIKEEPKAKIQVGEAANFGEYPFFTSGDDVLQHIEPLVDGERIYMATGGVANVKYFDKKAAYSTDTYVISSNETLETKYLYYEIDRLNYYINSNYFLGSGLKHLQKKDFKKHEIIFPTSINEQKEIISLLTKIDISIKKTQSLIEKYSNIKKGLMHDLLIYGIDEKGQIRNEKTHNFKDSTLGRIPVEWEIGTIYQYLSNNDVAIKPGPFGSSIKKEMYKQSGYKVYGQEQVISGNPYIGNYFIDSSKYDELQAFRVKPGDILLSCMGTIGHVLEIPEDYIPGVINPRLMRFRLNYENTEPSFFMEYIKSYQINIQLKSMAVGITMDGLNKSMIEKLICIYIPKNEQKRIMNVISKMDKYITREEKVLEKQIAEKQGLMSDLLTGKVRVKVE